jgi:hypothetical protein
MRQSKTFQNKMIRRYYTTILKTSQRSLPLCLSAPPLYQGGGNIIYSFLLKINSNVYNYQLSSSPSQGEVPTGERVLLVQ